MRALLDTHALLWALKGDSRLSKAAASILHSFNSEIFISAATAWEISTKVRIGKLPTARSLAADFTGYVDQLGFKHLPITLKHAAHAGSLSGSHRDPFDRMLMAQSILESFPLISVDDVFDSFGVVRIW